MNKAQQPSGERQNSEFEAFRGALHGQVVLRGDPGYDTARKVWNGAIDSYPAMIVYCANAEDVVAAVRYARSTTLSLAVRSGGHNLAGLST
ncbi:MAG: FAD-binding protein, partial [Dyella sp.]|nr:FAD-binding protein [Dyella sp.]